jgi:tRNA uridine 5-carboxymethylaminomethyl modification enzyme
MCYNTSETGENFMYDVIVIGAGHAGVEAALASARQHMKTAMCTISIDKIAMMPCNPSIGGPAKGIVVAEIDALGGQMGITADRTALQFKMLNTNKGPGVWSLRVQSDKLEYSKMMKEVCLAQENLDVIESMVDSIIVEDHVVKGVVLSNQERLLAKAVVITTGTYMRAKIMISDEVRVSGPDNLPTSNAISDQLKNLGFRLFRLKTGTPPRVLTSSIDFSKTVIQPGDEKRYFFSPTTKEEDTIKDQYPCYLTYTSSNTHDIIHLNLNKSSMYSGVVEGVGPRYCPSIEDKVVRFSDKERHQIFLEPQSVHLNTTYIQGFSTSLPRDVQEKMLKTIPGCENAIITEYAYAIEYDAIEPTQLYPSLETRLIKGLFCAGQINGTSGYEEAAGQGIIAGINAGLYAQGKDPLILARDDAYIGVMIDDLISKGTLEPYRLLTSRAEYRLLLRHDNAQVRLSQKGYDVGLLSEERYNTFLSEQAQKQELLEKISNIRITSKDPMAQILIEKGYTNFQEGILIIEAIRRPHISLMDFVPYLGIELSERVIMQLEIEIKYEGYIAKARKEAEKVKVLETWRIPSDFDYSVVPHLSIEGRQKLSTIKPMSIAQASKISGVNPADIQVLLMALTNKSKAKDQA